ncbi:MAG TPA: hypothetical protein VGM63_24430 [Mucilaginibacter sp.]|jgi:hypothetical protein
MKFNQLYEKSIRLWPNKVNISDGKQISDGILFADLSSLWNNVERECKLMGEWFDLMGWTIFSCMHNIAKQEHQKGARYMKLGQLNKDEVKEKFEKNIQVPGYEDMLVEYKKDNP